jgi:hypothetical protein
MDDRGHVTFVNVIEVGSDDQDEVVRLLREGIETLVRHRPGFVAAEVLASTDGTRVLNVVRWRGPDDLAAAAGDPALRAAAQQIAALGRPDPRPYSAVAEYRA